MAMFEQALVLDPPAELHIKPPFCKETTSYLTLTNPTSKDICFKVKTTAPKAYCVRPNGGIILPGKSVSVAVILVPADQETVEKYQHKFMIQSIFAPDGEYSFDSLWRDTPPERYMNSKLISVFDVPGKGSQKAGNAEAAVTEIKVAAVQESSPKKAGNAEAAATEIEVDAVQETFKKLMWSTNNYQCIISQFHL